MWIKSFHVYLGLTLCLIMMLISVTGGILVWKKEYLWLSVDGASDPIETRLLSNAIDRIEASYPEDQVQFIQLYSENLSIHKIFLKGRRYAWHNQQGEKIEIWSGNQRWEDFFLDLHHRFLLGNTIGLHLAGFGGMFLLVLLLAGLKIWWPRRRLLRLGLLPKSIQRGAITRSHGNIGAVFSLPIFILALTGVMLVYPVESQRLFLNSFGEKEAVVRETKTFDNRLFHEWGGLINLAQTIYPDSVIRSVQPSSTSSSVRVINVHQHSSWDRLGRTSLKFHPNGLLVIQDELRQPKTKRLFDLSYPIHTAKFGLLYKISITMVSLALTLLCLLGLVSYIKRQLVRDS